MKQFPKNIYKSYIQSIRPYEPGKPIQELKREMKLRKISKLASNENPLGPSPRAVAAMRKALKKAHLYPEGSCPNLTTALAKKFSVGEDQVIVGNGSNEIIELVMRGFVSPGDEVISSEYSFLVYPLLTQVCGGRYIQAPMKNYRYDLKGIAKTVSSKTRVIFIANPNNPTGTYVSEKEIRAFLRDIPQEVVVCFDEAYLDFVDAADFPDTLKWIRAGKRPVLTLRTFSKAQGLAGLRIGYGLANSTLIGYLHKVRQPFNVNAVAQAGAVAVLGDKAFSRKTRGLILKEKIKLYKAFDRLGYEYLPSQANFVLINVRENAALLFKKLLKKGVIIRPMAAYQLPTWIRVTIGRPEENRHFLSAFEAVRKPPF